MSCNILDFINIPYIPHGRSKEGYDCYGLVIAYLETQGIKLPDIWNGANEIKTEKLLKEEKNCIIMFNKTNKSHIGVYVGNGYFLHTTEDVGSHLSRLSSWQSYIVGFYKVTD